MITTDFIADNSYNYSTKIADLFLTKGQLIVHLEKLSKGEWVRILYFIGGVMYDFNGGFQKNEHITYKFTIQKYT